VQPREPETAGRPPAGPEARRAPAPGPSLERQLAAAERSKKWRAFLLTAPLLLFLLLTFLGPIGALLSRSVVDTEFAAALPNVAREIRRWDGHALPDEATFAALIAGAGGDPAQLRRQRLPVAALHHRTPPARPAAGFGARHAD
jgi:hypothetical protein